MLDGGKGGMATVSEQHCAQRVQVIGMGEMREFTHWRASAQVKEGAHADENN